MARRRPRWRSRPQSSRPPPGCGPAAASAEVGVTPQAEASITRATRAASRTRPKSAPGGVAHEGDAGGYWHGSAANGYGAYHGSDYGGYYHGTYANAYGGYHTGAYGAYYHQPVVVNSYGAGCYNCGYGGWGAAAAGAAIGAAAVGTAAAVDAAAAAPVVVAPPVWPIGMSVGYLPDGCVYVHRPLRSWYQCPAGWLEPAYGANGLYYRVVPAAALKGRTARTL